MKAVKVEYTVKPGYVEQNKANIQKVMDQLKLNPIKGMQYSTYTTGEGNTFVHINMAKDDETLAKLNDITEFNDFRKALMASEPLTSPQTTKLNLVAAGFDL
jgi:hypothetical protein